MREERDPASGLTIIELDPPQDAGRLAFVLHGRGANKEDLVDLGEVLARDGWRVVLPDAPRPWGPGFAWYESTARSRDLPRARELVRTLVSSRAATHEIARENVLLCGFSQGGVASLDLALHAPGLVARVACLSGYLSVEDAPAGEVAPALSVFLGHGSEDDVIPIERAQATHAALEARAVRVSFREYPIPHTIAQDEIADLREWLAT